MINTIHIIYCDTCGRRVDNDAWGTLTELKQDARASGWKIANGGDAICNECAVTARVEKATRKLGTAR